VEKALLQNQSKLKSLVDRRTATWQYLSSHLMQVQDDEHRRISLELHDSLGQYLSSIKMNLDLLSNDSNPTTKTEILSTTTECVERCITETRTCRICCIHRYSTKPVWPVLLAGMWKASLSVPALRLA